MTSPQPYEPPAQPQAAPPPPELNQPYYPAYPQPYPQSYPQGYPQQWPMPMPGTNGFAIAGFVCSFFSVIGGILGIVFGAIALSQIKVSGQRGKGLAIAGLAIGSCWFGFVLIAIISSAAAP
jgi:hypothetical protein